jgi:hypothetical protein
MAKQSDGRHEIAKELAAAFESVENSGNVIVHCLNIAAKHYGTTDIPRPDLKFVCDSVAVIRGWTDESAKVRKSECRAVLSQYAKLPDAIKAFKSKSPTFDWRDALRLARNLRKSKGNVNVAVRSTVEAKTAKRDEKNKPTPKQAKGRATAAMNLIIGLPHLEKAFKADVLRLARKFGFTLNVDRETEAE